MHVHNGLSHFHLMRIENGVNSIKINIYNYCEKYINTETYLVSSIIWFKGA